MPQVTTQTYETAALDAAKAPTLDDSVDKLRVIDRTSTTELGREILLEDALVELLQGGVFSKLVKKVIFHDLTSLGALFQQSFTLPAGAVIKYLGAIVDETVVADGTTVKLAIGINSGDVDALITLGALVAGTKAQKLFDGAVAASSQAYDLNGIVTAGTALGDSNITAGKVRVVVVYEEPLVVSDL